MTALLYIFGYMVIGMTFSRAWYSLYPWKRYNPYYPKEGFKWWGERIEEKDLKNVSVTLGAVWPIVLPVALLWVFFVKIPWMPTQIQRAEKREIKQQEKELEMREREARVAEMERSLGITR